MSKKQPTLDVDLQGSTAIVGGPVANPQIEQEPETPVVPGANEKPYCRIHNVAMIAGSSPKSATIYRCRVKDCQQKAARLRPGISAPTEPLMCPECKVACEVDQRSACFSGRINLKMQCPKCEFNIDVPRPDAAIVATRIQNQPADMRDIAAGGTF